MSPTLFTVLKVVGYYVLICGTVWTVAFAWFYVRLRMDRARRRAGLLPDEVYRRIGEDALREARRQEAYIEHQREVARWQ